MTGWNWLLIRVLSVAVAQVIAPAASEAQVQPIAKQDVHGTCQAFNEHVRQIGIKIGETNKPKHAGITIYEINGIHQTVFLSRKRNTKLFCACNNMFYEEISTCQSNCRVTLGCFSRICMPKIAEICMTYKGKIDMADIDRWFTWSASATRLNWVPSASSLPDACLAEVDRWNGAVEDHERQHITDSRQAWEAVVQSAEPVEITMCGLAEQDAAKRVSDAVSEYLTALAAHGKAKIDEAVEAFHEQAPELQELNCSICP
jgi:hypothetical protein